MNNRWKTRLTNIYMYIGLISAVLLATGLDIGALNSWKELFVGLGFIFSSPSKVVCLVLTCISALVDPTSKGLKDGDKEIKRLKGEENE